MMFAPRDQIMYVEPMSHAPLVRSVSYVPVSTTGGGGWRVLGNNPEGDEVDDGVVADIVEAAVILVHPCGESQHTRFVRVHAKDCPYSRAPSCSRS